MEDLRYAVSIKKGYKFFWGIFSLISFICALCVVIFSVGRYEEMMDYASILFVVLFLVGCSLLGAYANSKSIMVYKGKYIYKTLFFEKEYKPLDVYMSKTETKITEDCSTGDGLLPGNGSIDEVTTFYDKRGKKLFAFGLSYDNVERFKKTVENNRKSTMKYGRR